MAARPAKKARREGAMRMPATHFIALRLSQTVRLKAAIQAVHEALLQHDRRLSQLLVEAVTAHFTAAVLTIPTDEQLLAARQSFEDLRERVWEEGLLQPPLVVELRGLHAFGRRVLHTRPAAGEQHDALCRLAGAVQEHFRGLGLPSRHQEPWVPHLTLAKAGRTGRVRSIPPEAYSELELLVPGCRVEAVDLCPLGEREEGEYYPVLETFSLVEPGGTPESPALGGEDGADRAAGKAGLVGAVAGASSTALTHHQEEALP